MSKQINLINPIPPKKQKSLTYWLISSFIIVILLIILLSGITIVQLYDYLEVSKKHADLKNMISEIQTKLQEQKNNLVRHEQLSALQKKITRLQVDPKNPANYLNELSQLIPSDVALITYKQNHKKIDLEGQAFHIKAVTEFIEALNNSTYFTGINLLSLHHRSINNQQVMQAGLHFTVTGTLKI